MPISFVFSGTICLTIIFDLIRFKNVTQKCIVFIFFLIFALSFFAENIDIYNVYFNVIQLILFMLLLLFLFFKCDYKFKSIMFSLSISIVYFIWLNFYLQHNDNFNFINEVFLIFELISFLVSSNIYDCMFCGCLSIFGMSIIGVVFEFELCTFSILNLSQILFLFFVFAIFKYLFCYMVSKFFSFKRFYFKINY